MKKVFYWNIFLLFVLFQTACNNNLSVNRDVSFIKYLEPGVNKSFAAHAISGDLYAIFGLKQISDYDFGTLSSFLVSIKNDELSIDTVAIPADLSIAFPSNLVVDNDKNAVFFALAENQDLLAIKFDSQGKYLAAKSLVGFNGMVVLAATFYLDEYWLLINDTLSENLDTRTFIVKMDKNFSTSTIMNTQGYNAKIFSDVIGENLFNKYYLYAYLQNYCFFKNFDDILYLNSPIVVGGIVASTTIGFQQITEIGFSSLIKKELLVIPYSFIKEIDIDATGILFPVLYNYKSQDIDFYNYNEETFELNKINAINSINPNKKMIFAVNNTGFSQEKLIVATNYDNQIHVYSPINESIHFDFGGSYDSEVIAAFWGGSNSDQLIIFGNTQLYNHFQSNFVIMLPKESLFEIQ